MGRYLRERLIDRVLTTLTHTYPTFANSDDEWMTSGMPTTPFGVIVSTALSCC